MSRLKSITLTLLAVCALGAAISSSASAFSYLVLGGFLHEPKEPFTSSGGPLTLASVGTETICEEAKGSGVIELTGLGLYHIVFTVCRVAKPANCRITEPILLKGIHHLALSPGGLPLVQFLPATPPVFVKLIFANNGGTCPIAGEQSVEGSFAGLVVGGEKHALTQELEFTNTTTALTLAGVKANFKLKQKITLNSDMLWGPMMQ